MCIRDSSKSTDPITYIKTPTLLLYECLLTRHRSGSSTGAGTDSESFLRLLLLPHSSSFLLPSSFPPPFFLLPFFFFFFLCFAFHAFLLLFSTGDPPPVGSLDSEAESNSNSVSDADSSILSPSFSLL